MAAAAAAVVVALLPGAVPGAGPVPGAGAPLAGPATSALTSTDGRGAGPLERPEQQASCLAHLGLPAGPVLAARPDRAGAAVRLVLATDTPGRFRELVVTPDCGPHTGTLLADTLVGR